MLLTCQAHALEHHIHTYLWGCLNCKAYMYMHTYIFVLAGFGMQRCGYTPTEPRQVAAIILPASVLGLLDVSITFMSACDCPPCFSPRPYRHKYLTYECLGVNVYMYVFSAAVPLLASFLSFLDVNITCNCVYMFYRHETRIHTRWMTTYEYSSCAWSLCSMLNHAKSPGPCVHTYMLLINHCIAGVVRVVY